MAYGLFLKKQDFKFSSSHFTLFSKDTAEHLHGHNYQVAVKMSFEEVDEDLDMAVDFNVIKNEVRSLCKSLDEKILIPKKSKYLKIENSPHYKDHIEVQYNQRHYCFPQNEVFFLPVRNITSEALAKFIHDKLKSSLNSKVSSMTVSVFETQGQAASYSST